MAVQRNIFYYLAIWSVIAQSCIIPSVTPFSDEEQAKLSSSLEMGEYTLKKIHDILNAEKHAVANIQSGHFPNPLDRLVKVQKLVKAVQVVGALLEVVSFLGIFTQFIFAFLPNGNNLIFEEIQGMNRKLDDLSTQMNNMRDELKTSIEFNNWLTAYITWELEIRKGEIKLQESLNDIVNYDNERDRMNAAGEYINFFENNGIEQKMFNIYAITGKMSSSTTRNLFELFAAEHNCDVLELSKFMQIIRYLMSSAAKQTIVYYSFKGRNEEYLYNKQLEVRSYMYDIRWHFDNNIWACIKNTIDNSQIVLEKEILNNQNLQAVLLNTILRDRLIHLYPWYNWAVLQIENEGTFNLVYWYNGSKSQRVTFESRGNNYYVIRKYGEQQISVMVTWQDMAHGARSCDDSTDAKTLVYFELCKKCHSDVIIAPDKMLTSVTCIDSTIKVIYDQIKSAPYMSHEDVAKESAHDKKTPYWIAVNFQDDFNPCGASACNRQGECKHIPATHEKICLCEPFWDGESCEEHSNATELGEITKMIADLRQSNSLFRGVPTIVDVFYEIRDMQKNLDNAISSIHDSIALSQSISANSDILNEADYVTHTYSQLLSGNITYDVFGNTMASFLMHYDVSYMLKRLQDILLGKGIFEREGFDFFSTYKRAFVARINGPPACSESYALDIGHLMKNLAILDLGVNEALLRYYQWRMTSVYINGHHGDILTEARNHYLQAKIHQQEYFDYWRKTSCPKLEVEDMVNNYCNDTHSYEGLTVKISCTKEKTPSVLEVTCRRTGKNLGWSQKPQCQYEWGAWSSWSTCNAACGWGKYSRTRSKPNNEKDKEDKRCYTQDCCQEKYGKFKCRNNECISRSRMCDGKNDCRDGSDESTGCNYLRSGDTVALKGNCGGWLSCYCTVNCNHKYCRSRTCPGEVMNSNDWSICKSERFTIFTERGGGQAVRYGEQVALKYGPEDWLSCWDVKSKCTTRKCPGTVMRDWSRKCEGERYKIYSVGKEGSCSGDTSKTCTGRPIGLKDKIFLMYKYTGGTSYYVSDRGKEKPVETKNCPGRYVSRSDENSCKCEVWTLSVKP